MKYTINFMKLVRMIAKIYIVYPILMDIYVLKALNTTTDIA